MRAAAIFIALPLIATLLNALVMGSRHFVLSSWPAHAYHHLARQIVLDCGMSLLGLLLLHHFLMRRRERWARRAGRRRARSAAAHVLEG